MAGGRAPSFLDIAEPDDRILFVNTFSKNWAMTGWRVGWLAAPPALQQIDREPDPVFDLGRRRLHAARRDRGPRRGRRLHPPSRWSARRPAATSSAAGFGATGRVRFAVPAGAFYLFFAIDGDDRYAQPGLRLVDEANVGLAPGTAFGQAAQSYLRLCFAREPADTRGDRPAGRLAEPGSSRGETASEGASAAGPLRRTSQRAGWTCGRPTAA